MLSLRPKSLLKKRLRHRCFPTNFADFLRAPFFHRTPLVAASVSPLYDRDFEIDKENILQN